MYSQDIKKLTLENSNFRTVLYTGTKCQLVAMCITSKEGIGEETHNNTDQILFFIEGECEAVINGEHKQITKDEVVFVPAGTKHNFINTGNDDLKLYTVYAPPEHADGTIHKTKQEATD